MKFLIFVFIITAFKCSQFKIVNYSSCIAEAQEQGQKRKTFLQHLFAFRQMYDGKHKKERFIPYNEKEITMSLEINKANIKRVKDIFQNENVKFVFFDFNPKFVMTNPKIKQYLRFEFIYKTNGQITYHRFLLHIDNKKAQKLYLLTQALRAQIKTKNSLNKKKVNVSLKSTSKAE
jgi:hypothetical protein